MTELRTVPIECDLSANIFTGETHDLLELLFSRVLATINECTPEFQPSDALLSTAIRLLEMHKSGVPGPDFAEALKELAEKVEEVESHIASIVVGGGGRRR